MSDRIEKSIDIKAPRGRVWRALTDHLEFGTWFGVVLSTPFVPGQRTHGKLTKEKYAHLDFAFDVDTLEPEQRFAFRWHPYAMDAAVDYSKEEPTLVEFLLEDAPHGTRLTVTESGFDKVPAARRELALRMNTEGWAIQVQNLARHVQTT